MGEVIVLDEIHPTWRVHSSFMKYHRNSAVDLDALESSHPVQMECKGDPEEAIAQSL
jgi:aminopeptidase 2